MQICVLGPLAVRTGSGVSAATVDVGGARLRTLLILLALDPGRLVPAQRLIAGLWAGDPPAAATGALQALVSRLRRTVPGLPVEFQAAGYRLALPAEAVDAVRFERLVADGREALRCGEDAQAAKILRVAIELWRGPPLADVADAPFARAVIARLEERRLAAVEGRIKADLRLGGGAELVPELAELAAAHPLRESVAASLMRALCAAGRPGAALDAYEGLRRRLADELGADPSGELRDLHASVLGGAGTPRSAPPDPAISIADSASDSAADSADSAAGSAGRRAGDRPVAGAQTGGETEAGIAAQADGQPRTNLRAALSSFVGRSRDAEQVRRLVSGSRLVTLVGPGGAGKTRLAVETGRRLLDDGGDDHPLSLPDGAWLVELAPVTAAGDLPQAVFAALGLREQVILGALRLRGMVDSDPVERLTATLAGRRMLLLLDNCEHLLDPVAALAEEVLGACPQVRILATSREPLAITGETLWPVEPLALPPARPVHLTDRAAVAHYPAVRLFADRAAAVRPGFRLGGVLPADGDGGPPADAAADEAGERQIAAVVRICRALDGMPLAIELAAARLRAMTPEQVAARLDDRFRLLNSGSRTALPRHRTLAAVVSWSWDLLDEPERALWRRLAIFPGGVTVASARAVCVDPPADRAGPGAGRIVHDDVPDLLTALVEKSLLICDSEDGAATPRYRQLETIREYGLRRLAEAGEREWLRAAHAEHFLRLAERAEPVLRTRDQLVWLRLLAIEQDNLHAALRGATAAGDAATAVRMSSALGWYWWLRGRRLEGAQLAEAALELPGDASPARAAAGALAALNAFDGLQDEATVIRLLRLSAREIEDVDDLPDPHPIVPLLGGFRLMLEVGIVADEPLEAFRGCFGLPDPWTRALARVLFAYISANRADAQHLEEARTRAWEAVDEFEALGERWGTAFAHGAVGELASLRGEHALAVASFRRGCALTAELDSADEAGQFQMNLVAAALALRDVPQAQAALEEARRSAQRAGTPDLLAGVAIAESSLARFLGDTKRARELILPAAAAVWTRHGPPQFKAAMGTSVALAELSCGRLESARLILAAALAEAVRSTDAPVTARVLVGVAHLALRDGDAQHAAELVGACVPIRLAGDHDLEQVDRAVRDALGQRRFDDAVARGRAVPLSAALDLARLPPVAWPPPLPTPVG
ncbi:BTAD domain-containing putative transcriptional regulator [Frankia sp. AgKG'84/4]